MTFFEFLLTRPSRGATQRKYHTTDTTLISTHTPLAGRDDTWHRAASRIVHFYSHAPRGARLDFPGIDRPLTEISTHTPLAGRDTIPTLAGWEQMISTHTPLAGRDRYI